MAIVKVMIVEEGQPVRLIDWDILFFKFFSALTERDIDPTLAVLLFRLVRTLAIENARPTESQN